MADDESKLREHAYRLWEEEGRPDGRAKTHWDMAREALAGAPLPAAGTQSGEVESSHAIEPAKKPKGTSKTKDAVKSAQKGKTGTKAKSAAKPAPKPKTRKKA